MFVDGILYVDQVELCNCVTRNRVFSGAVVPW